MPTLSSHIRMSVDECVRLADSLNAMGVIAMAMSSGNNLWYVTVIDQSRSRDVILNSHMDTSLIYFLEPGNYHDDENDN